MNLDAKIEKLRRLHEAATPAPWMVDATVALGAYGVWTDCRGDDDKPHVQICSVFHNNESDLPRTERDANAAFIAAAHNSLPALLAELDSRGRKLAAVEKVREFCEAEEAQNRTDARTSSTPAADLAAADAYQFIAATIDDLLAAEQTKEPT